MNAQVTWHQKMTFTGTANSGFKLPLGASPDAGGDADGFRPLELLAIGLAGCTAMDVISILGKKRQEVTGFEVKVHADQAQDNPHVFTHIHVEYVVRGKGVDPKAVERAIELSATKYCSASKMLEKAAPIEHSYQVIEAE